MATLRVDRADCLYGLGGKPASIFGLTEKGSGKVTKKNSLFLELLCLDARGDAHRHKLLDEELHRVRKPNLDDVCVIFAVAALVNVLLGVRRADHTASAADEYAIVVGGVQHTLFDEGGGAVGDDSITLHFADA